MVDLGDTVADNETAVNETDKNTVFSQTTEVNEVTKNLSISQISSATEINCGETTIWENVKMPSVIIAAIDNGLAFPFKHPDEWRAYPYRWATLPNAQLPFSEETIQKILPLLDNTDFVRELGNDLKRIFEVIF